MLAVVGDEMQELLACLADQRTAVVRIVGGLDETAWHTPVVPSGWTVAGLVEHIGDAEGHWFQGVLTGANPDLPYDEGRPPWTPDIIHRTHHTSAEVLAYYREQCAAADVVLAGLSPDDAPVGGHGDPGMPELATVRQVVLHVIEETACHSGHLDIARELLDGRTDLGGR